MKRREGGEQAGENNGGNNPSRHRLDSLSIDFNKIIIIEM